MPEDVEKGIINQALLRIRLNRDLVNSKYFIHLFRSAEFQKMIFAKSQGSAMPNLVGIKEFKLIPLNIPSLPEQQAIVQEIETRLSVCDKIEQDIETNLEKAEALRQSILKKAFEGKLLNERELAEVRGAEDWEPAEVLLEKIKAEKAQNGKK